MNDITNLPMLYKDLVPLTSKLHEKLTLTPLDHAPFASHQHLVPLMIDEFVLASHFYPIIFAANGENIPFALMGMNAGHNTYIGSDGSIREGAYVPAYIRRYPFLLAKLSPESEQLSLCMDPTAPHFSIGSNPQPLFTDGAISALTQRILDFCKEYEQANSRTRRFTEELRRLDLLIDGEFKIEHSANSQPFVYRGFKMVAEDRLRDLRGDTFRKLAREGSLPMIYTHLLSLGKATQIFARQMEQQKITETA